MRYGFINNFSQLLASDLAIGATTMTLDGGGALLSAASADLVYTLTLDDGDGTTEIVHVTAAATNTLTIVRAQEGTTAQAWPAGSAVEARVTAAAIGGFLQNLDPVIGTGTQAVEIGPSVNRQWTEAIGNNSVCIGYNTYTDGVDSTAIGQAWAKTSGSIAIGKNVQTDGLASIAMGSGGSATGDYGVSVGGGTASGVRASSYGKGASAVAAYSVALGASTRTDGEKSASVGYGGRTDATAARSVVLGNYPWARVPDALLMHCVPYIPGEYPGSISAVGVPEAARHVAPYVALATETLDLTDGTAFVALTLPAGTMLFMDSIDVVINGSATPGGAPEIRIGPDDVTPATYLAATAVIGTAVGARQTHAPLVGNGITSIRVETVTAGTGTLAARVIFRGYVMEL